MTKQSRFYIFLILSVGIVFVISCRFIEGLSTDPTSKQISPAGGEIEFKNTIFITFPEGAVSNGGTLTVNMVPNATDSYGIPEGSSVFEIKLEDANLTAPVKIAVPLPKNADLEKTTFQIYHFDENPAGYIDPVTGSKGSPTWVPLPTKIEGEYVVAWVDSFSKFKVHRWYKKNEVKYEEKSYVDPEYIKGSNLNAWIKGLLCLPKEEANKEVTTYTILEIDEGFKANTQIKTNLGIITVNAEGCLDFNETFLVDISEYIQDRNEITLKINIIFHSDDSDPSVEWDEWYIGDGYFLEYVRNVPVKHHVLVADAPQLSVAPYMAQPGQSITVIGEKFKPRDNVRVSWQGLLNESDLFEIKTDKNGNFRVATRVPENEIPGPAEILASNDSGLFTTRVKLGIIAIDDQDGGIDDVPNNKNCLELTLQDDSNGYVFLSTDTPTAQSVYRVQDLCGTVSSTEWVVVNDFPGLADVNLINDNTLQIVWEKGIFPTGRYLGNIGIHYPRNSQPVVDNIVVEIVDFNYLYPANTETISEVNYSWGKYDKVEANFTCTRTDIGSANEDERFLNGFTKYECPAEYSDKEMEWTWVIDRLTGETVFSTCENCWDNLQPNPEYNGPTQTYAGFIVPIITEKLDANEEQKPIQEEKTNGYWQWVGTETRVWDGITGRWIEQSWDKKNLFTGTHNGAQYTAEYFGNWSRGRLVVVSSTRPYGFASLDYYTGTTEPSEPTQAACEHTGIPDIVSKKFSLKDAAAFLSELGFSFTWKDEYLGDEDVGLIVAQAPAPGFCGTPQDTVIVLTRNVGSPQ